MWFFSAFTMFDFLWELKKLFTKQAMEQTMKMGSKYKEEPIMYSFNKLHTGKYSWFYLLIHGKDFFQNLDIFMLGFMVYEFILCHSDTLYQILWLSQFLLTLSPFMDLRDMSMGWLDLNTKVYETNSCGNNNYSCSHWKLKDYIPGHTNFGTTCVVLNNKIHSGFFL